MAPLRILLIEDNRTDVARLSAILSEVETEFELVVAPFTDHALERVGRGGIDLVW